MGTRAVLIEDPLNYQKPVVLFDSTCLLCNRSVLLLLKIDKKQKFAFASITSEFGKYVISKYRIQTDSIILFYQANITTKSEAILKITSLLGFPYSLFLVFYGIPIFIRDWMYSFIASNRIIGFGKLEHCLVSSNKYLDRILN